jgi:hypothetical protein
MLDAQEVAALVADHAEHAAMIVAKAGEGMDRDGVLAAIAAHQAEADRAALVERVEAAEAQATELREQVEAITAERDALQEKHDALAALSAGAAEDPGPSAPDLGTKQITRDDFAALSAVERSRFMSSGGIVADNQEEV